jgi:gas vesicle protein
MSDRDEFGAFLIGFIVGGLTGAVTALLLAPQSGEETREIIKEKAIEISDKASHSLDEAYSQAETATADARKKLDELAKTAKEYAEEVQSQGQVLLEEQKAKLEKVLKSKETEAPKPVEPEAPAESAA